MSESIDALFELNTLIGEALISELAVTAEFLLEKVGLSAYEGDNMFLIKFINNNKF